MDSKVELNHLLSSTVSFLPKRNLSPSLVPPDQLQVAEGMVCWYVNRRMAALTGGEVDSVIIVLVDRREAANNSHFVQAQINVSFLSMRIATGLTY